ncbi:uncharacterized protein FFB20_15800 [Fusarium fujikuroi]|nr:uncharacterized protein FFB20_15800 [Fusarium fujikuroi]SCO24643.1 uncharacterized protein FFC1_15162 [Fusarium fujikuroi]SCO51654.1 uncharacterized protein FFNC_13869 [Fusarium fujikuroi]
MAGIGKTTLLDHLCTWWWKALGMIEDAIHIHLNLSEPFSKDNMLQQLQRHFIPNCTLDSEDRSSLYEHFESHKCLIIIDDLDSAKFNRQQGQFINLTSKLSKSDALVIFASRKRERWLSKTKVYKLSGLHTRPATLMVMDPDFRDRVTDNDEPSSPEPMAKNKTQEERDCLEAVIEMPSNRTRLDGIYEELRSTDWGNGFLPILLAPFMGVLPTKDFLTIFCIWSTRVTKLLGKAASTRLVHAAFDLDVSYRDNTELTEEARVFIETLLNAAEVAEPEENLALSGSSALFHKDLDFSEPASPADSFLTARCDRIKDGLIDGGMLEDFTEVPDSMIPADRRIMRLNPLIPLLLRQHPAYKNNSFSLQLTVNEAFVLYYCYRGKKWPWDHWDDHREWGVVDAEMEMEFDNFASACMTGLVQIDLDTTHLMGLMRIAAVLEHGAGEKFYYRKTIISQVWTVALAKTLIELKKL